MIIYNTKNETITGDLVRLDEIQVGNVYALSGLVERGVYKGKLNTYFKEYVYRNREVLLMTKEDGSKPFAVATNDCERDGFEPFHLSKILVEKGYHVIYAYHEKDDPSYAAIKYAIFEVTNVNPIENDRTNTMLAKVVTYGELGNACPAIFTKVLDHAEEVFSSELVEQLIPKYCFNPNRVVTLQLFQRNENGDIESFLDNGTRLIMNNNSLARFDVDGKEIKGGLFRVFYSKKFKDSKHIYVDGKALNPLQRWDIDKYIEESYLLDQFAKAMLHEVTLKSGTKFIALSNINFEFRPVYKSSNNSYQSFKLSEWETAFIEKTEVIEWG